jgi:hypothetical protein
MGQPLAFGQATVRIIAGGWPDQFNGVQYACAYKAYYYGYGDNMNTRKEKQSDKKSAGFSEARNTIIAYFFALALELVAVIVGMHAGTIACASTTPSTYAEYSIFLRLAGLFVVIVGIINSFLNAKSLKGIGIFFLILCIVIAAASQLVQTRICF